MNMSRVKGRGDVEEKKKSYLSENVSQHAPHGLAFVPQQPVDILQILQGLAKLWQIKEQHTGR